MPSFCWADAFCSWSWLVEPTWFVVNKGKRATMRRVVRFVCWIGVVLIIAALAAQVPDPFLFESNQVGARPSRIFNETAKLFLHVFMDESEGGGGGGVSNVQLYEN